MSTHRLRERYGWRLVAVGVFIVAGILFVTSSLASGGLDLRGSSVTDLDTVLRQQRQRTDAQQQQVADLTRQVDKLGKSVDDAQVSAVQRRVDALRGPAGFEKVHGPAITVVLSDAPKEEIDRAVEKGKVPADQLVVHQQDIQAVVNTLWSGGAEAMTLQKQRVISTTGIKCVGNTVVLHGVPYAPPYAITAIGDLDSLRIALDSSDYIEGYKTYVDAHHLGYEVSTDDDVSMPAYNGTTGLRYAKAGVPVDTDRD
ncbi:MAG: DUF881 domain-containing protein [Marmoricola sp.]